MSHAQTGANNGQAGQLQSWGEIQGTLQTVPEPAALLGFEWCRKQWWKTATLMVPTFIESGKPQGEIQLNWAEFTHLRCLFSIRHPSPKYYRAKSRTSPGWLGSLPSPSTQVVAQCHPAAHIHRSTMILRSPSPLFTVWAIPRSSTSMPDTLSAPSPHWLVTYKLFLLLCLLIWRNKIDVKKVIWLCTVFFVESGESQNH